MNRELIFSDESARLYKDTNLSVIECIALAEIMYLDAIQSQGTNKNVQEKYITK